MWVRDRLDGAWSDEDFAAWYPRDGRAGISPAQLATVSVLQFLHNLSDRQAAEAVRCRIDFKYALVRHDAPLIPGGGERPPLLACRSRSAKLRAAVRRDVARRERSRHVGGHVDGGVIRSSVRRTVPVLACVVGDRGVRSSEGEPKPFPFHPGTAGEGKAGRVNASESSYAPLSAAPPMGRFSGV